MQANTNDRFVNIQIFAGLLRCIRRICNERLIGHLAIVDIEDASQSWYRYFFKLAGFSHCHCQDSAGSTLQLENRVCLAWRESSQQDISTAYEMVRIWLAEGRCKSSLLDSVASGEAAEVERKYFHDLLAEMWEEKPSQREQAHTEHTARGQMHSQDVVVKSMGSSALRAMNKCKRSHKAQKEGLWRVRQPHARQRWQL